MCCLRLLASRTATEDNSCVRWWIIRFGVCAPKQMQMVRTAVSHLHVNGGLYSMIMTLWMQQLAFGQYDRRCFGPWINQGGGAFSKSCA